MSTRFNASRYAATALAVITAFVPPMTRAAEIGNPVRKDGFTFVNFDPSLSGTSVGSNANGISNRGQVVVTTVDANNASTFSNSAGTPARLFSLDSDAGGIAFGLNSNGQVVGTKNGVAFFEKNRHADTQPLLVPANASNAFGINDDGNIVGQYTNQTNQMPGFLLQDYKSHEYLTINAPSGPNTVNAQGVNHFGLIVGFYLGTDGQVHGFKAESGKAYKGTLTGTAITDPKIPVVDGEPGATFVFSQILAVNDRGIAVGYYGDSTTSQHGFIYDTNRDKYTFLDDPAEAFKNGVEVTQITGISDSGELAGFYTDANGAAHSFVACPAYAFCPNFPYVLPGDEQ